MNTRKRITLLLALGTSLSLVSAVLAIPAATTLDRHVIGGGGGHTEAGIFILDATIGQALVGTASSASTDLCAGFWCGLGVGMGSRTIYLPLVLRHFP
jgi:hypothetical protein